MAHYTEKERVAIAKKQYDETLSKNSPVTIDNDKVVGTVIKIYDEQATGMKAIVVRESDGNISVLFQGSKAPGKTGALQDWLGADIPIALSIMHEQSKPDKSAQTTSVVPMQLEVAAMTLRAVMRTYPEANITVYGHSLGSMNAQYALANMDISERERIVGAWLYNGPNIYPILSVKEQERLDALKIRIHNYIDLKDPIGLGYSPESSQSAAGLVKRVDSKYANDKLHDMYAKNNVVGNFLTWLQSRVIQFTEQHMWGGYQYHADASVKMSAKDSVIYAREWGYAFIQESVLADMAILQSAKRSLASNTAGLTHADTLYLDGYQAKLVSKGLSRVAEWAEKLMKDEARTLRVHALKIYTSTMEVPFGFSLSSEEMVIAYATGGVTRANLLDKLQYDIDKKDAHMQKQTRMLTTLEKQIEQGISQLVAQDERLGAALS